MAVICVGLSSQRLAQRDRCSISQGIVAGAGRQDGGGGHARLALRLRRRHRLASNLHKLGVVDPAKVVICANGADNCDVASVGRWRVRAIYMYCIILAFSPYTALKLA